MEVRGVAGASPFPGGHGPALGELPQTRSALETGELSEDQVAVVVRHAPAHVDHQVSELARASTVTQLRRVPGATPSLFP